MLKDRNIIYELLEKGLPPSEFIEKLTEFRENIDSSDRKLLQMHKGEKYKLFTEELAPLKYFLEGCPYIIEISMVKYQGKDFFDDAIFTINGKDVGVQLTICEKHDEYQRRFQLAETGTTFQEDDSKSFVERVKNSILKKQNKSCENTILIIHANSIISIDDDIKGDLLKGLGGLNTRYKEIWLTSIWSKPFKLF